MTTTEMKDKWFTKIPHAIIILFGIMILVTIMSYLIPAGSYERELVDGRNRVIPGSYHKINATPISLLDMFRAIPLGFRTAVDIIFIVLAGAIMFGVMEKTKAIENAIGALVKTLGMKRKYFIVFVMTFVFGLLGVAVGYENNIALVPIAAVLSLAIGGDLVLAAGISVGAMTVGFGLSPINPYTVGTGHKIANLAMFSGWELRALLCFIALIIMAFYNIRYLKRIEKTPNKALGKGLDESGIYLSKELKDYSISINNWLILLTFLGGLIVILIGVFQFKWHIVELSAVFLMVAVICAVIARMNMNIFSETILNSVSLAAPGAFMVGFASSIKVLMEMGNIGDTISFQLAELLSELSMFSAAVSMSLAQCVINFFIPSGSGQALATLPVMLPLGDALDISAQTTILAFQIGDGVTNLINPTLGGLIAMLALCRVPLDRWFRFIIPLVPVILLISWLFLVFAVFTSY